MGVWRKLPSKQHDFKDLPRLRAPVSGCRRPVRSEEGPARPVLLQAAHPQRGCVPRRRPQERHRRRTREGIRIRIRSWSWSRRRRQVWKVCQDRCCPRSCSNPCSPRPCSLIRAQACGLIRPRPCRRQTPGRRLPPKAPYKPYVDQYADEPAYYTYEYAVNDDYSNSAFDANESREQYLTTGKYSVALPDGRIQTVTYTVDGGAGYVADVTYQGEAVYPPAPAGGYTA